MAALLFLGALLCVTRAERGSQSRTRAHLAYDGNRSGILNNGPGEQTGVRHRLRLRVSVDEFRSSV
jgi:hypothetical protein